MMKPDWQCVMPVSISRRAGQYWALYSVVLLLAFLLISFAARAEVGVWTKAFEWQTGFGDVGTVFSGRMWLMSADCKTVSWSADGLQWSSAATSGLTAYYPISMFAHAGKLWVFVADTIAGYYRAYSSTDGLQWTPEGGLVGARLHIIPFDGKLWFLPYCWPGDDFHESQAVPLVWTTDFVTSQSVSANPGWWGQTAVVFDDRLWIFGGYDACGPPTVANAVWWSRDGADWTTAPASPWTPRWGYSVVAGNGRIWVMGGDGTTTNSNDVWTSEDGQTWVQVQEHAPWQPRSYHMSFVFNNKIWVIGGIDASANQIKDAWYLELPALTVSEGPRGGWVEASNPWKLSAAVTGGSGPITYQWKKDNVDIPGATDATYDIASLSPADTGWYTCEITDSAKTTVQTTPVYLEVFPYASLPAAGPVALLLTAAGCLLLPLLRRRKARQMEP